MQKSSVKMMNTISEIENHILKGLVLDEHGNWIPIADKKAVEEDFLAHLSAGKVLHEGRWVSIGEAKSANAPTEISSVAQAMPLPGSRQNMPPAPGPDAEDPATETRSGTPEQPFFVSPREPVAFPPETKSLSVGQTSDQTANPSVSPVFDPQSGYAPETGAFVVEQLDENQPEVAEDDTGSDNRSTTSFLLPTVSSWEQSAKKGRVRILVFGGIGVALAGIGAILIIVMTFAR